MKMEIRKAIAKDFDDIWPFFSAVAAAGDTYGYSTTITREEGFTQWMEYPRETYVIVENGEILGSYYITTNHDGPGSHVCNCGYMVSANARGKGLATLMCEHSQSIAIDLGYSAMQFNFVASSNEGAVGLWQKLGFSIVGTLPAAFNHPEKGFVDAFVMYKQLEKT